MAEKVLTTPDGRARVNPMPECVVTQGCFKYLKHLMLTNGHTAAF